MTKNECASLREKIMDKLDEVSKKDLKPKKKNNCTHYVDFKTALTALCMDKESDMKQHLEEFLNDED